MKELAVGPEAGKIGLGKAALKIFVALEPCDMRKFFNELSAVLLRQIQKAGSTPWQKP